MHQRARGSAALKREPGIDESGGTRVVVDKKCLGSNPLSQHSVHGTHLSSGPIISHMQGKTHFGVKTFAPFSRNFKSSGEFLLLPSGQTRREEATLRLDAEWRQQGGTLFLALGNTVIRDRILERSPLNGHLGFSLNWCSLLLLLSVITKFFFQTSLTSLFLLCNQLPSPPPFSHYSVSSICPIPAYHSFHYFRVFSYTYNY